MCKIVGLKFDVAVIASRNAYLAADSVEAAISHKNDRRTSSSATGYQRQQDKIRALATLQMLSSDDFEVEVMGEEQRRQKREQVQSDVDATVGWGCPDTSYGEDDSGATIHSPKQFFHRTVQAFATATNEDDVKRTSWPGNMWVTGNTGTGKTTFSKLVVRHLRWYGAIRDEVLVEKNGMELRSGDPAAMLKTWFAEAEGGALFIDEAYSMLSSDEGQDDAGRSAVSALLTEAANKGV